MIFEALDVEHINGPLLKDDGFWIWGMIDGAHILSNRHFAMTFSPEEAEEYEEGWMLMDCLEHRFDGKSPTEGIAFVFNCGDITEKEASILKNVDALFKKKPKPGVSGRVTPLIYAEKHFRYRWCKMDGFDLFLQDLYLSILYDSNNARITAESAESPAFLLDGDILILPIKNMENKVENSFTEFEEAVKSLPKATVPTE